MIQELREYVFTKEQWPEYWSLFNNLCLPIRKNDYGVLKGLWLHEGDEEIRFFHLWQYESLNDRARLRVQLSSIPEWKNDFLPQAAVTLKKQFIRILNQIYELDDLQGAIAKSFVIYQCIPGQSGELIKFLKRNDRNILSIWQSEFGNPNEVVLLRSCSFEYDSKYHQPYVQNCSLMMIKSLTSV